VKKSEKSVKKQSFKKNIHYFIPESVNEANEGRFRPGRARRPRMSAPELTFEQLQRLMKERAVKLGLASESSLPNLATALSGFMRHQALGPGNLVGSALRVSFFKNLKRYLGHLKDEKRPVAYLANRKSSLNTWRKLVTILDREHAVTTNSPSPLQAALQEVFAAGLKIRPTARELGVPLATLKRLIRGGRATRRSVIYLERLERFIGMANGALTGLAGVGSRYNSRTSECQPLEYREWLRGVTADHYAVKMSTAIERFRQEWCSLLEFKTDLFGGGFTQAAPKGNTRWRVRSSDVSPLFGDWVDTVRGKVCPTAGMTFSMVCQFFGWLQLGPERGGLGLLPEKAQCLGNLANVDYVKTYIDWRIKRSRGKISRSVTKVLILSRSMCHPDQGFLVSRPDIGARMGIGDTEQWRMHCQRAHSQFHVAVRNIEPHVTHSRDPFEPIRAILELKNPLKAVKDALKRIDTDRPVTGGLSEAIWARDRLLVAILSSNPLRAMNLRGLTWRADNTGMLRQDSNGGWRIVIMREHFKNQTGAARHRDYNTPVQMHHWPFIEVYLRDYRPILLSGSQNDRVFVSHRTPAGEWKTLNKQIAVLTGRYLHGCPGTGPHAFRHLMATAIIKKTGSYSFAAIALHDEEETVRRFYGHLGGDDGARWIASMLDEEFEDSKT
jgi:integrase